MGDITSHIEGYALIALAGAGMLFSGITGIWPDGWGEMNLTGQILLVIFGSSFGTWGLWVSINRTKLQKDRIKFFERWARRFVLGAVLIMFIGIAIPVCGGGLCMRETKGEQGILPTSSLSDDPTQMPPPTPSDSQRELERTYFWIAISLGALFLIMPLSMSQRIAPKTVRFFMGFGFVIIIVGVLFFGPGAPDSNSGESTTTTEPLIQTPPPIIIFQDEFIDNSNRWELGITTFPYARGETQIDNVLRMDINFSFSSLVSLPVPTKNLTNFVLDAEATLKEALPENSISLAFGVRRVSGNDYRLIRFRTDGYYSVVNVNCSDSTCSPPNISWMESPDIHFELDSTNKIRLHLKDSVMTLFFDDVKITEIGNMPTNAGYVTIGVYGGINNSSTIVEYDNLVIYRESE